MRQLRAWWRQSALRWTAWWYMTGRISWPMRLVSRRSRRLHAEAVESGAAAQEAFLHLRIHLAIQRAFEGSCPERGIDPACRSRYENALEPPYDREENTKGDA